MKMTKIRVWALLVLQRLWHILIQVTMRKATNYCFALHIKQILFSNPLFQMEINKVDKIPDRFLLQDGVYLLEPQKILVNTIGVMQDSYSGHIYMLALIISSYFLWQK